jgi:VWFA-related protein
MLFMFFMVHSLGLAQQKPPVFRTRVDLLQLDVTVLDRAGWPVRGLTADDFIVLEDNKPQEIQGFSAVDLPDTVTDAPVWANTVSRDVASNEMDSQRIFVIVIDDALGMGITKNMPDPWAIREMKKSAALLINSLGPADLAALVFTNNTRKSQNLTDDHARLLKAIEAYPEDGGGILMPGLGSRMDPCLGRKYSVGTIQGVVESLAPIPDRRKAIVYFGGHMPWANTLTGDPCFTYSRWQEIFAAAQQSHVTINPVYTMGMGIPDSYIAVADNTGGHAIVGSNDFEPGIHQVLLENSSYYLLAYQPTNELEDGTFRRIKVTVKGQPDLEVRTRRSYWAPRHKSTDPKAPPPPPELAALSGVLPLSDLGLRATASPFAIAGTTKAVLSLAVGVKQFPFVERTPEQVELLIRAFTADGDERGSAKEMISITVPAARRDSANTRYELLARIELPRPGKYEIRVAGHSIVADTRGSVYLDVEVPDFRKDLVSLSGIVFDNALPAWPVAPLRAFRDLMPVTPTTERTFARSDIVTAFVRVYQGGKDPVVAVPVAVSVLNAAGESVLARSDTLAPDRFSTERSADYQLRLPLATLPPGEYLLTIDAVAGKSGARRGARFQVR